jgi:hypothetical protein
MIVVYVLKAIGLLIRFFKKEEAWSVKSYSSKVKLAQRLRMYDLASGTSATADNHTNDELQSQPGTGAVGFCLF